ncbi:MAG: hypothetical protein ACI4JM_10725 [Oscillospiraceae bacterium]
MENGIAKHYRTTYMRKGIPMKNSRLERRFKRRFEEKHNTRHLFKQKGWSNYDYYRNKNQKRKHNR